MRVMIKRKLLRLLDTMQSMHKIIAGADIHLSLIHIYLPFAYLRITEAQW